MKATTFDPAQIRLQLQSFLDLFNQYSAEIFGNHDRATLDELRNQLQQTAPLITSYFLKIIGDGVIYTGSFGIRQQIAHRDLLFTALMGGNNEETFNFTDFKAPVTSILNQALGKIDGGLWPPKEPKLTLVPTCIEG